MTAMLVSVLLATPEVVAQPGAAQAGGLRSDVNRDGRDDILTFHRGSSGDVFAAVSTGNSFSGTGDNWGVDLAFADDLTLVGDFNGDDLYDVMAFQRGTVGNAWFMPSNGQTFVGPRQVWSQGFVLNGEIPVVGDFNGDGRDDVAAFTRGEPGTVRVGLSNGSGFAPPTVWLTGFARFVDLPFAGDFNGDGRDDIVGFNRSSFGDVQVALSDGFRFQGAGRWHDNFAFGNEIPGVGDFNGDGRDDIVTFHRSTGGNVYVATSTGNSFSGTGVLWHDNFSFRDEIPGVGDFNGDGRDDIVTFHRGTSGNVYVATSTGTAFFGTNVLWHDNFAFRGELPQPTSIIGPIIW